MQERRILCALLASATILIGGHAFHHKHRYRAPIINLNGAEELVGSIREDQRVVAISPHLHILSGTGPICRYDLSAEDERNTDELPFESEILDKTEGSAQIRLREGVSVDCSDKEYRIRVVAVRCSDESSKSEA